MPRSMSDQELALFARYVAEISGIHLDQSKRYLLEGRLAGLLEETGCQRHAELYAKAKQGADASLKQRIIDAISTRETSFFRDKKPFALLQDKLVPELLGAQVDRPLAIWSAGCSTGQEAYSIAICLERILFELGGCRIRILGTDISEAAVRAANRGEFSRLEVERGLDTAQQAKYFIRHEDRFRVRDDLRALCQFQVENLLAPRAEATFDIIFCRNVLIYFAQREREKVVAHLLRVLKPNGALIIGSTESLLGVSNGVQRKVYRDGVYYTRR